MPDEFGEGEVNQVESASKEALGSHVEEIKETLKLHITPEGLVPEVGERGKDEGFNSEMLGYGLRLAVETNDRELFDTLKKGADFMKMENGLFRARLDKNKEQDFSQGSTWSDANQDIALAYLTAGGMWGDGALIEEGKQIAEAFYDNQVASSGELMLPLQNTREEEEKVIGGKIKRVNPSMYNFRLYKKMAEIEGEDTGRNWEQLRDDGLKLIEAAMDRFKLPPNTFNLEDGQIVTNEDLVSDVKEGGHIVSLIPEELVQRIKDLPENSEESTSIWGFDSMRIPYRLCDSELEEGKQLSLKILERLEESGGVKTKYYALNGSEHPEGTRTAVVEAPLAVASAIRGGNKKEAMEGVVNNITEVDEQVLYWQLWRGLGLQQLKRTDLKR